MDAPDNGNQRAYDELRDNPIIHLEFGAMDIHRWVWVGIVGEETGCAPKSRLSLCIRGHLSKYAFILARNFLPCETCSPILFPDSTQLTQIRSVAG